MKRLRKYLAGIPLVMNLAVAYIALPLISGSQDQDWAARAIITISFFGLATALQFGLPAMLVKLIASEKAVSRTIRKTALINCFAAMVLAGIFILAVYPSLWWLLLFVPAIFFVSLQRAIWEGTEQFIKSYMVRMVLISILPLTLAFTLEVQAVAVVLIAASAAVLFVSARSTWAISSGEPDQTTDRAKYAAFLVQSLAAFSFIFFDRYVAGVVMDPFATAIFIRDFEMIYRFTAPMFFVGSLLFPSLASSDPGRVRSGMKEIRVFMVIWLLASFLGIPALAYGYQWFGLDLAANPLSDWSLLISITVFGLGASILLQRIIMALADDTTIFRTFLAVGLATTVVGGSVTAFAGFAPFTLAAKTLVDVAILSFVASKVLKPKSN